MSFLERHVLGQNNVNLNKKVRSEMKCTNGINFRNQRWMMKCNPSYLLKKFRL